MDKVSEYQIEALEDEKPKKKDSADNECIASGDKEQEHCTTKPSFGEIVGDSKIQELTDEETEKLQKQLFTMKVFRSEEGISAESQTASIEQLSKIEKNPLLLSPIVRYVLKFLNIEDIKNCRLVCREWNSIGKVQLGSRGIIRFTRLYRSVRCPVDFYSCFQNSANLFSAFKISGYLPSESTENPWKIEELTQFFDKQQKYIKELTLAFEYSSKNFVKNINLSAWVLQSPLMKQDAKYMTKLTIERCGQLLDIPPLHRLAHIKDLTLTDCRINLDAGIKLYPVKMKLNGVTFFQDGTKLDRVRINDIVDLGRTRELSLHDSLHQTEQEATKYSLDLRGIVTLEKLTLLGVTLINGQISQWVIGNLFMHYWTPTCLNSQMKINEIRLSFAKTADFFPVPSFTGTVDLSTVPKSMEKFTLIDIGLGTTITCSQPIVFANLQYLYITDQGLETNYSYLSHFMNCPKLTRLQLYAKVEKEMKSVWMPKMVKTLFLEDETLINWVDDNYLVLDKLVLRAFSIADKPMKLCEARIHVEDFVVECSPFKVDQLVEFLAYRKRFGFGKRLYIGKLWWDGLQLETSILKDQVDVKSSFYVFENGQKGRAISGEEFYELIPQWQYQRKRNTGCLA